MAIQIICPSNIQKKDKAGISTTMQSSSHAHKKQKHYYRYHMHPCRTATTKDDTVQCQTHPDNNIDEHTYQSDREYIRTKPQK